MTTKLLSNEQAVRVIELDAADINAIIRLASFGQDGEGIRKYAKQVADGEDPGVPAVNTAPRALTVMAWSFCHDRVQYGSTYGLSSADAAALSDKLLSEPDSAAGEISAIVTNKLRKSGSQRPVIVKTDGIPGSRGAGGSGPPTTDGGLRSLKAEIRTNSGVYGSYHFAAEPTGKVGTNAYAVKLGGGLYTMGQSKPLVIAAARVVRVKGRSDDLVRPLVAFWDGSGTPKFGSDISEKVTFTGMLGPEDALPKDPATKSKTLIPGEASSPGTQ